RYPPPPTAIYPLSLHDALPIYVLRDDRHDVARIGGDEDVIEPERPGDALGHGRDRHHDEVVLILAGGGDALGREHADDAAGQVLDRKSTRLNSSHRTISYAVFC